MPNASKPSKPLETTLGLLALIFVVYLLGAGVWRILTFPLHISDPLRLVIELVMLALMIYAIWYFVRTFFLGR